MTQTAANTKVTYICCSNDARQLDTMLMPSLRRLSGQRGAQVNWLVIDTTANRYPSAARAYNKEVAKHASEMGDILVFCHNDIAFDDASFHDFVVGSLLEDPNQIIGVAGKDTQNRVPSNLRYRSTGAYITRTRISEPTEVCSLDECCFALTADLFRQLGFDEQTCYHWHLYAVDLCYAARLRFGTRSVVSPQSIYHKQSGDSGLYTDQKFLRTMWRMVKKYHRKTPMLFTPCYHCSTNYLQALSKLTKTTLQNILHRL